MALLPSFIVLPTSSPSVTHTRSGRFRPICSATGAAHDNALLLRAAEAADYSAGHTAPHPNFGCVIAHNSEVVGEGFLYAEGTKCAELQAIEAAGELARGATAYLNMEPGDCHGDQTPVSSLVQNWNLVQISRTNFLDINQTAGYNMEKSSQTIWKAGTTFWSQELVLY